MMGIEWLCKSIGMIFTTPWIPSLLYIPLFLCSAGYEAHTPAIVFARGSVLDMMSEWLEAIVGRILTVWIYYDLWNTWARKLCRGNLTFDTEVGGWPQNTNKHEFMTVYVYDYLQLWLSPILLMRWERKLLTFDPKVRTTLSLMSYFTELRLIVGWK